MESPESKPSWAIYERWFKPFDAIKLLLAAGLDDREHAVNWLRARARSNTVRAIAADASLPGYKKFADGECVLVPNAFWRDSGEIDWKHDFWISGDFQTIDDEEDGLAVGIVSYGRSATLSQKHAPWGCYLVGVRFQPDPIIEFVGSASGPEQPVGTLPTRSKSTGGRPPKPFWDQLWVAICAQLFKGELIAKRQADIERAMHEWLTAKGEEAGETAGRAKAKLLWEAINSEVEN